ncbi:MAG: NusA-like transcription termination signal-binding factor [Candidatus Parvarchaeota archaeon]|nr:NusA-like transcription termination signal-binding factor [Candidatus Jingweiarchaeum tengchongense]MCW1298201.1 NusA-like transcription termination signal-binding factor [Candidatus Jingweiarchaeum tengchongense]MCW1299999.1 NusA-like transcription termination signal-binding factor [Candidatus Jingweiarchaeum tengchongense]MCW1305011.1 NusA-like transcription termination signal-binding factor [Candidatus Jingweiarchaeum tengchongense]MCW1305452.1 NusA-like transcription termination signal-b
MKIKLDTECIRYMSLFETLTGATVKDCIINTDSLIFVVKEGDAGLAIGKNGQNIKNLEKMINKRVEVIEFSPDPLVFTSNIFRPIEVKNIYLSEKSDGKKIIYLSTVKNKTLTKIKLKKAKSLVQKYFGISDIVLT